MAETLPVLLTKDPKEVLASFSSVEIGFINQASRLFEAGFYDHCLLDLWNAAVANLRRKVEAYGVDLFVSVVKEESGRKRYDKDGETLSERWQGVDDLILIAGATGLRLLNKKAGKSLEMINWMRNHASPAHGTDHSVEREDVIGLALILQKNLFEAPLPDPGHSVSGLFDPVKKVVCTSEAIELLEAQIKGLKAPDIRVAFGFMLDMLCSGEEPALGNVVQLLPVVWERASDDIKATAGLKYHTLMADPTADTSGDKGARSRLLDMLAGVDGVRFVPDAARASIYRNAAKNLAKAKDGSYGWAREEAAAETLAQFGPHVPSIAFEEVYQEILAVWCGNYWGRSAAWTKVEAFIECLNSSQILRIAQMFQNNDRVRSELFQTRPNKLAIELLKSLRGRLSLKTHISEIDQAIEGLKS